MAEITIDLNALVDVSMQPWPRQFRLFRNDAMIDWKDFSGLAYLGTVRMKSGLTLHVFEKRL